MKNAEKLIHQTAIIKSDKGNGPTAASYRLYNHQENK